MDSASSIQTAAPKFIQRLLRKVAIDWQPASRLLCSLSWGRATYPTSDNMQPPQRALSRANAKAGMADQPP